MVSPRRVARFSCAAAISESPATCAPKSYASSAAAAAEAAAAEAATAEAAAAAGAEGAGSDSDVEEAVPLSKRRKDEAPPGRAKRSKRAEAAAAPEAPDMVLDCIVEQAQRDGSLHYRVRWVGGVAKDTWVAAEDDAWTDGSTADALRVWEARHDAETAAVPAATAGFAHAEGDEVEVRRGAAWHPARVDNVNEDDGTFDLVCEDGDEDGVAAHLIRPRPLAGAATKAANKAVTTTAAKAPNAAKAAATKAATKATASSASPAVASQVVQAACGKRKGGAVGAEEAPPPPKLVPSQHDKKQASLRGFFAKRTGA